MRCASFNVLADSYTEYADYSHSDPNLMQKNARIDRIVQLIDGLNVDIIGLQEVEEPLRFALEATNQWQLFWSPKEQEKPDGCLMLVKNDLEVDSFNTFPYSDKSGHIMQKISIGGIVFANTHIKWCSPKNPEQLGVGQATELVQHVSSENSAVIFADCNDRPNGPVRQVIKDAGFDNVCDNIPTAIVHNKPASLDLIALRGVTGKCLTKKYPILEIPNEDCPSDHIPLVAEIE